MLGSQMTDNKKKAKYLSKSVKFAGKTVTMYSLDGATWSTRKEELHLILERQEQERASFNQLLGEAKAKEEGEESPEAETDYERAAPEIEDEAILPIEDEESQRASKKTAAKAAAKSAKPGKKTEAPKKAKPAPAPKSRASSKPASKKASGKQKRKVA
jgi:hypothetical protein